MPTLGQGYSLKVVAPEQVLDAIDDTVAVTLITEVDYRTGRRHDMAAITARAHANGALTVWDLAHSAGALPVDLSGAKADFAVGCTYKYLNSGPGGPAFIYVAPRHAAKVRPALSGWLGHEAPFAFDPDYRPGAGIERMRVGTPPVLQLAALESALDIWDRVEMADLRAASLALTDQFIAGVEAACPTLTLVTPRDHALRGSQVSFRPSRRLCHHAGHDRPRRHRRFPRPRYPALWLYPPFHRQRRCRPRGQRPVADHARQPLGPPRIQTPRQGDLTAMAPTIRPYRPHDRAAAELVFYRAVREGAAAHYPAAELAAWAPSPEPDWTRPDKLVEQWCHVAEEDGRMTGFFSMDDTGYLDMAFVIPEVMGNGTAAALYDTVMAHARAAGLTRFTVKAAVQSHRFLARRGWQLDRMQTFDEDGHSYTVAMLYLDDKDTP